MMTIKKGPLEYKLRLFFLGAVAAIIVLGITSFAIFISVTNTQSQVIDDYVDQMVNAQEIQTYFERMVAISRLFVLSGDANTLVRFGEAKKKFLESLDNQERNAVRLKNNGYQADLAKVAHQYIEVIDYVIEQRKAGFDLEKTSALLVAKVDVLIQVRDFMQKFALQLAQQLKAAEANASTARRRGIYFLAWSFLMSLLLGVILYWLLSKSVREKVIADKNLEKEKLKLERSNKELEQFASVAAHDLRSPLNSIVSWIEMLDALTAPQSRNETIDQAIAFIKVNAKKSGALVDDLLQIARANVSPANSESVDLNKLLNNILVVLKQDIENSQAEIKYQALPTVIGNPSQLEGVFSNLIRNALTYRDKDRTPKILIGYRQEADNFEFFVQDNGIGIEPENSERIFEMFTRLHSQTEFSGTGIGLAYCKKVVELNGGKIWVNSVPREGSSFFFTYPQQFLQ